MVEHLVLFKWKGDASPDAIAAAIRGLKSLKDQIEGIVDLTVGENFSARSQGYQCGLVVRFTDRAALDAYGPHPAHQDVVLNLLAPIREDTIAVDYEIRR
jgi:hypothetical protein